MYYTADQRKALRYAKMCRVVYSNIWEQKRELGYSTKGKAYYSVVVAKDAPSLDIKRITLLHELGHVIYNHLDSSTYKEDLNLIKSLFEKHNKPFESISKFGGPMSFLNICMDFEVNSKLLTLTNIEDMNNALKAINLDFGICTPKAYDIEVLDSYRDYFEPLIEKIDDEDLQQLAEQQKDLAEALSNLSEGLDSDIRKALEKEGYLSGSFKGVSERDLQSAQEAEDAVSEVEAAGDSEKDLKEESSNSQYGSQHSSNGKITLQENSKEVIKKFLTSIIGEDFNRSRDIMRHHNHGTRRNSEGILYAAYRNKHLEQQKRLAVVIDVSGSMYTESIITALSSLKDSLNLLHPESRVFTWDTSLCEDFSLNQIPESVKLGGGTDIASALRFTKERGFTDIVIYSDFWTNMESLVTNAKEGGCHIYSIVVGDDLESSSEYLKINKSYIYVENR